MLEGGIITDETGASYDATYLQQCWNDWGELLEFFGDLDRKVITLTLAEYNSLPSIVTEARRVFQGQLESHRKSQERK